MADAVRAHSAFIAGETLATELTVVPAVEVTAAPQPVGEGGEVRVAVAKSLSEAITADSVGPPSCPRRANGSSCD